MNERHVFWLLFSMIITCLLAAGAMDHFRPASPLADDFMDMVTFLFGGFIGRYVPLIGQAD